jgi:hypothetical protein
MSIKKGYIFEGGENSQFDPQLKSRIKSTKTILDQGYNINFTPGHSGLFGTHVEESLPRFKECKGEKPPITIGGASIVLGRDRPTHCLSGYGGIGAQKAASIDLVVGRMASARKGKGPKPRKMIHNHFGADAARIHISQLTNIDKNFSIAKGRADRDLKNASMARSGIGIKADHVRVIGREGIKIVTGKGQFRGFGKDGELNSRGGKLPVAGKIELIAGNNTEPKVISYSYTDAKSGKRKTQTMKIETLQPAVLGDNLLDALQELVASVDAIAGALLMMSAIQTIHNVIIGIDPLRPWVAAATSQTCPQLVDKVINNVWQTKINLFMWQMNYQQPFSHKRICSSNVSIT